MAGKAVKKNSPEAVRTRKATSLAVGSIAVFAMTLCAAITTIAASGMPFFEIEEVHIEQLPQ
ncbi:MAG: hypothetical protein ACRDSJ_06450 [Rubrobacteraceae bacterium]